MATTTNERPWCDDCQRQITCKCGGCHCDGSGLYCPHAPDYVTPPPAPKYRPYDIAKAFSEGDREQLRAALEAQETPIRAAGLAAAVAESGRGISMLCYREISYQVQKWGGWY